MSTWWTRDKPPRPGWYNASFYGHVDNAWRWWDGKCWSQPAWPHYTAKQAAEIARMKADPADLIAWRCTDKPDAPNDA